MDYTNAVIWDMDGVLVNTGEFHYSSWKTTLEELGTSFSEKQFLATFGMNNSGVLEFVFGKKLPSKQIRMISERKERLFRQIIHGKAKLLPGISDALEQFSRWNMKQAIASSAPPKNIQVLVEELKIGRYFDVIVSGYDIPGKPDPAVFLKAAQQLEVPPVKCIVIEDAVTGVEGAKNAGMKCIAVTTTNQKEALSKADLIFDNLKGLNRETILDLLK